MRTFRLSVRLGDTEHAALLGLAHHWQRSPSDAVRVLLRRASQDLTALSMVDSSVTATVPAALPHEDGNGY